MHLIQDPQINFDDLKKTCTDILICLNTNSEIVCGQTGCDKTEFIPDLVVSYICLCIMLQTYCYIMFNIKVKQNTSWIVT